MERETKETLLWIFCIVIVVILSAKIVIENNDYTCSECTVTFTNTIAYGEQGYDFGTYKIKDLFDEITQEGHCAVSWDPTQGYING